MAEGYDVAQICENGHVITAYASAPEYRTDFCQKCGAKTLMTCPQCSAPIRGGYIGGLGHYNAPNFCARCGVAYPWTATALSELHEIGKMVSGLSDEERQKLDSAMDELVTDTPRTERAALTVKMLAPRLGAEAWGAMRAILVSIATEAAKKSMGL